MLKKCTGLAPGGVGLSVCPFLKEHNLIKALLGWEQFTMVFFFFFTLNSKPDLGNVISAR